MSRTQVVSRTQVTIVKPPERVQEFTEVFGSATVPVRGWIVPHRANLPIGRRDVYELDLDALGDAKLERLIRHLAAKFGVDEATVRGTLRSEGVAIVAEDCVVSSDGPPYDEGWQGSVYRWLGKRIELLARRVGYTHRRFDLRYHVLDPLADRLAFRAMRRGLRSTRG